MRRWLPAALGSAFVLGWACRSDAQLAFRSIGFPVGASQSEALRISPNGQFVVGKADSRPFRWNLSAGLSMLLMPYGVDGTACAICDDGTAAGYIQTNWEGDEVPVTWTPSNALSPLPLLGASSEVRQTSPSGGWYCGRLITTLGKQYPVRWTSGGGTSYDILGQGLEVSEQGTVLGLADIGKGFLWRSNGSFVWISNPNYDFLIANDMTADETVCGWGWKGQSEKGFFWTEGAGFVEVPPTPAPGTRYAVTRMNADATVSIVHSSTTPDSSTPCLYTEHLGLVPVKDFLVSSGLSGLAGWTSFQVCDISADGSCIAGTGVRPDGHGSAYWARLPEPKLDLFTIGPAAVQGGASAIGTVSLYGITNYRPSQTTLNSSAPEVVSVPPSVTVVKGSLTASFAVSTVPVATTRSVVITATLRGLSKTAVLTVTKDPALLSLTAPTTVNGGGLGSFQVNLTAPAPSNMNVAMSSSAPLVLKVPATVAVLAGTSARAFNATGYPVLGDTLVTVTATRVGVTRTATTTVLAPRVKMITLAPTSVLGGTSSVATVTLTTPSPTGGCSVDLYSSVPSIALPPASLTVPAGATSAQATVITAPVGAQTSVTIRAKRIVTKAASLLVTP